nr:hypothetical protein [Tanacetum cinerariifolium]
MLAFLTKSDASEGFEQILDFLNASVIQYALTVNLTIYVSCIKQFWSSVSLKKTNDVVRLQALIDRRKVIITKATVRQVLRLDDADSIDCLPNEEIFAELARMGLVRNVDSPSKFYMYPRFLQLMINAHIVDLSSHNTKYTSPALTQKVFANMKRVGKGFSRVDTLLFEGMLVPQQVQDDNDAAAEDEDAVEPTPPSPTPATTPPPPQELIPSSSHNTDADTTFEVKEPESEVHVSLRSNTKTKKHDDKTKREAKGKSPVELSTRVRNLCEEFEYFSSNSTNEVNAASTPVTAVEPNSTNSTNTFTTAGPSNNAVSLNFEFGGKSSFVDPSQYPDDPDMPALEDITYSDDEEDVGAEADFSNLEANITVSPIPTTRVHKDHHVSQIISDLFSAPLTRSMTRMVKDQGGHTQINTEDFHTCMFA